MFIRAVLSLGLLAAAQQALATPACLLAAVNKTGHPADQKRICCSEADTVKGYLQDMCHANANDAVSAFEQDCKDAGFDSCSSSSSSSASSGLTSAASSATGAPYPVVFTTTYYDEACSCTTSKAVSSTVAPGSTGFASGVATATGSSGASSPSSSSGSDSSSGSSSGSGSGSSAGAGNGAPMSPSSTSSSKGAEASTFSSSANQAIIGSATTALLLVAGLAIAL